MFNSFKRNRNRSGGAIIACALLVGITAGCGKSNDSAATNSPAPTDGNSAPPASGKKLKMVYIPKNTANPYFDAVNEGFKKAAQEQGFDFATVAPATADAASQIPFIKQQIQLKVDAIAISPNSPDAVLPALKEALARGIKVVTVDADLTGHEEGRSAAVMPTDFNALGKNLLETTSGLMGGQGDFAILSATTDAPNQNFWITGIKETLKDPKYSKMKLVEIAYGNDDPQKSLTEAQGLLTKYPNLKAILAPTTVAVAAAAQATETANAASRVAVTGLGTPNQMRRFVENGAVKKFMLWDPADQGYVAANLLVGLCSGTIKPAAGVTFKAGTLGDRTFADKNLVVVGPPVVFDKANIGQFHF